MAIASPSTYGRPYMKGRKIWGSLVPWGKAWRMGSDEATTLITQQDIMIGDLALPAGAYTLYMLPAESGTSKLAVCKKIGQWGIPVDTKDDLGQVDLKKDSIDTPLEEYTMAVKRNSGRRRRHHPGLGYDPVFGCLHRQKVVRRRW